MKYESTKEESHSVRAWSDGGATMFDIECMNKKTSILYHISAPLSDANLTFRAKSEENVKQSISINHNYVSKLDR